MRLPIESVWVVVPCHDEAALLGRFLASLEAALDAAAATRPEVGVRVALVLDSCTDGSAALVDRAARRPEIVAAAVAHRSVGRARAAGVELLRAADPRASPAATWLACTDADGEVPPSWLLAHLAAADGGADLMLGTVRLSVGESDGLDAASIAEWGRRHPEAGSHRRVHGANLGVRLEAYTRAGGFAAVDCDEDVRLAAAVQALPGISTVSTHESPVRTSARSQGRTPRGFAGYLRQLRSETRQALTPR